MIAEQIKKNVSVVDVLDRYMGTNLPMRGNKSKNIPCPIHGGNNDNFAVDTEKNIATCFSKCNKTWNVIDLMMAIHNTDFKGAISLIEKDFNVGNTNTPKTKRKAPVSVTAPTNARKDYNTLYNSLTQDDYFLNRGLSKEIIDKYRLGSVYQDTDLSCLEGRDGKFLKAYYNYVLPVSDNFFVARVNEDKVETDMRYRNFGQAEILNKHYVGDASKDFIFVVEGMFDALSIETLGYNAIALNSASNASLLIKAIQENQEAAKEQNFILIADNDEAGKQLEDKLQTAFKKMSMSIMPVELKGYKDINEVAASNPDEAENILHEAVDGYANKNSAFNILVDFFTDMKRVEPIQIREFPKLNSAIGGLRTGLYVLGAASSLGKTTFIQEIADTVAEAGDHVLFFSLEMGKKELVSKSLVRTMGNLKRVEKMKGEITYARDLLDGNVKNHDMLMTAVGKYEKASKNLFIIEGAFDIDVYTIREEVEKHIRVHKKRPLVIVDYLQVLEPINDRLSEKQATDKNITELKRITRDLDVPLMAISSFNRDSYNKEASFSSFKESGSIEYGSDVVIALELRKIKDLEKDSNGKAKEAEKLNEAKGSTVREINLKILKNRFGKAFEEIEYKYITTVNKFTEN